MAKYKEMYLEAISKVKQLETEKKQLQEHLSEVQEIFSKYRKMIKKGGYEMFKEVFGGSMERFFCEEMIDGIEINFDTYGGSDCTESNDGAYITYYTRRYMDEVRERYKHSTKYDSHIGLSSGYRGLLEGEEVPKEYVCDDEEDDDF